MTTDQHQAGFFERFDAVRLRVRRTRVLLILGLGLAAFSALVTLLAAVDYRWELEVATRSTLFILFCGGAGLAVIFAIGRVLTRWGRPTTASALEDRFPELGQSVRTTVQYRSDDEFDASEEGVAPTLVEALETTTLHRTAPLHLETVVPVRRCGVAVAFGGLLAIALAASTLSDWEWNTAVRRALLVDAHYTTLAVVPGDVEVEAGLNLPLEVQLEGRTDRIVVLRSRPVGSTQPWSEFELAGETTEDVDARTREFHSRFVDIQEPLEYCVIAGPAISPTYTVGVRYPIAIESIESRIEPPAYTGLPFKTVPDGNITALEGSHIRIQVELDREPTAAELVLESVGGSGDEGSGEQRLPLTIEGHTLHMELDVRDDLRWSIVAESSDGSLLADNSFRLRVRYDQRPQVSFADPDDELEVHSLAEVLMRIQARDDYGLSRSGIVFQINNGEEYTLLQEDYAAVEAAAAELSETTSAAPRTLAVLQELLPLEHFSLTQKDCVVYYAFAEDNYPAGPRHTESELRFVDIRPFKQTFRRRDPGDGNGDGGDGGFTSLDELIRRERYALNRTLRLDRRTDRFGEEDLTTMDRLVEYQTEIADLTRELAEELLDNLVAGGADDVDVLFQAEAAMVNAVDSLQVAQFDTAFIQQKDAQQYLVEARNKLEFLLQQAQNNATLRQALGLLNSRISQKLRRMDNAEEQETREAIIDRLQQLAEAEQGISTQLYAAASRMQNAEGPTSAEDDSEPPEGGEAGEIGDPDADTDPSTEESDDLPGGTQGDGDDDASSSPSLNELETMQYDVVTEARDIQQLLNDTEGITELAMTRMETAAQTADGAAGTLAAGDTDESANQTADAAEMFAELARQVQALLADEAAEQVALSRGMAAEIADRERDLAARLDDEQPSSGGGGDGEEMSGNDEPVQESTLVAERARTLEDVLQAIAGSTNLEDGETADNISEIIAEQQLPEAVERIEQIPTALETGPTPDTLTELNDLADRMELTAAQLDRLYRSIVTPRMELLRELEEEAVALEQEMPQLDGSQGVQEWEMDLEELTEEVVQAGAGTAPSEELLRLLGGIGRSEELTWSQTPGGNYLAPDSYRSSLRGMIEDLQQQIQELVLADLLTDRNEVVPPQYEPLIEQYLKVLSETAENP